MKNSIIKNLFALSCLLLLAGCGYRLASFLPTVLGERNVTIKVRNVEHPTLAPWMSYAIRSTLRDAITEKNIAQWVDSGEADYEIEVRVISYQKSEWMTSEDRIGQLYDQTINLEGIIYKGSNTNPFWRSGQISQSLRSDYIEGEAGSRDILKEVMKRLTDRMQDAF